MLISDGIRRAVNVASEAGSSVMSELKILSCGPPLPSVEVESTAYAPSTVWIEFFNVSSQSVIFERLVIYGSGFEHLITLEETINSGDFIDIDLEGRGFLLTHATLTLQINGRTEVREVGNLGGEVLLWLSIGIMDVPGEDVWVLEWYTDRL
jgi:hypothetical protein